MFNRLALPRPKGIAFLAATNGLGSNRIPRLSARPLFYLSTILILLLLSPSFATTSRTSSLETRAEIWPQPSGSNKNGYNNSILGLARNSLQAPRSENVDEDGDDDNNDGVDEEEEEQNALEINKLAESRGFSIESHRVTTGDGYILTVHRLVNPLIERDSKPAGGDWRTLFGPPVIVQHGILCASTFFLLNSSPRLDRPRLRLRPHARVADDGIHNEPDNLTSNSLAIELAQRGYDVWLPNFRGTQYSSGHLDEDLNEGGPNRSAFWNFNVDTLVEQDLFAYVNYVLDSTGSRRYIFIGHSLGATVGLGSLLVHRQSRITEHLSCAILMAPVASTQYMRGRLMSLFRSASMLYQDPGPFPGTARALGSFVRRVCPYLRRLCLWIASMFLGPKRHHSSSREPLNNLTLAKRRSQHHHGGQSNELRNQVNTFLMMMRQSISVQMLRHIVQVNSSGRLSRFNYGPEANALHYGAALAPVYNLSKIREPNLKLAIVSGQSDAISTDDEVGWISEQVRDKVGHFEQITVPVSPFNHMDLIMSSEAGKFVNKRLLEFIQNKCLDGDEAK